MVLSFGTLRCIIETSESLQIIRPLKQWPDPAGQRYMTVLTIVVYEKTF